MSGVERSYAALVRHAEWNVATPDCYELLLCLNEATVLLMYSLLLYFLLILFPALCICSCIPKI